MWVQKGNEPVLFDLNHYRSVRSRDGVPYAALALMLVPSVSISYFYAFGDNFITFTLDATVVIATMFLGSAVAAAVLPWRRPEIYNAFPIARYSAFGMPLMTIAAAAFAAFLVFCMYQWVFQGVYGVNHPASAIYMLNLYGVAIALYVGFRLLRRVQGTDLSMVYDEIPED